MNNETRLPTRKEKKNFVQWLKDLVTGKSALDLYSSLAAILIGLILGFILLIVFNPPYAVKGLNTMLTTGIKNSDKLAKVFYTAAPLIMTGLSVAFAFKTGLFNIGASGQYTVGAFCALVCAIQFQMSWPLCLIAAMIGGAIWGFFPGLFKALFNVNEVITAIMFNWIGLYAVNLALNNMPIMLANAWGATNKDRTANLYTANPDSVIPKLGLDELMNSTYMNIGIFITIAIAIIIHIILNKTTFGYELKACGYNRNASIYAGINAKRNITLSTVIAGALAGIGGGIYYLSATAQYTIVKSLVSAGFNGIPVALLASSSPIGVIFAALFISYIQVGGEALQPEYAKEIVDIIISAIIYLSAFSLLLKGLIARLIKGKTKIDMQEIEVATPVAEKNITEVSDK